MTERELAEMLRNNPDLAVDDPYHKVVDAVIGAARPPVAKLTEHDLQVAVIAECDRRSVADPRYARIFHPASGEFRTKSTAAKLKRMGVRRGLLDLYLICPNKQGKAGWACELKVGSNRPTPEQKAEMDYLNSVGWAVECIWNDARLVLDSLERYLA